MSTTILLTAFAVPLLLALGVFLVVGLLATSRSTPAAPVADRLAAERRRGVAALLCGGCVAALLCVLGVGRPDLLGLPLLVSAPLGATAALALHALVPRRRPAVAEDAPRSASLQRRTAATTVGRSSTRLLLGTLVVTVVLTMALGATSSHDDQGRSRAFSVTDGQMSSTASPYAGWFYAVPLLISIAVLVLSTVVALHRIGATPALVEPRFATIDRQWRSATARLVTALALAACLFPLGAATAVSALAIRNSHLPEGSASPLAWAVGAVGLVLILAAVVAAARAVSVAGLLPRAVPQRPEAVASAAHR